MYDAELEWWLRIYWNLIHAMICHTPPFILNWNTTTPWLRFDSDWPCCFFTNAFLHMMFLPCAILEPSNLQGRQQIYTPYGPIIGITLGNLVLLMTLNLPCFDPALMHVTWSSRTTPCNSHIVEQQIYNSVLLVFLKKASHSNVSQLLFVRIRRVFWFTFTKVICSLGES